MCSNSLLNVKLDIPKALDIERPVLSQLYKEPISYPAANPNTERVNRGDLAVNT